MNAQVKIDQLLLRLTPILDRERLGLCNLDETQLQKLLPECRCIFREREGICALLPRHIAEDAKLAVEDDYRQITLHYAAGVQVPGLTAIILRELADAGIQVNVVSARCHEHVLVRDCDAAQAMQILYGISNRLQYS
ncbi:ACT domain-containing protein [Microbulbifer sp. HZ11]|uniref:ACT domain-containing protein n=1 Tax=unclassified Microbulbifer TaxID=2619833 RepID=UPI0005BE5CBF|nr:ACT domain-containing protein [Microbulbifer sp. HZ11]